MGSDLNPDFEPKLMDFTKTLFTSLSIELAAASSGVWAPILSQVLRDYLIRRGRVEPLWDTYQPCQIYLGAAHLHRTSLGASQLHRALVGSVELIPKFLNCIAPPWSFLRGSSALLYLLTSDLFGSSSASSSLFRGSSAVFKVFGSFIEPLWKLLHFIKCLWRLICCVGSIWKSVRELIGCTELL